MTKTDQSRIIPFLWFNNQLEEAMNFYTSVFKKSAILSVHRNPDGAVMTATFELDGQKFYALNGGPMFSFTEAISFFVKCETQDEVDDFWEKLSEGGQKSRCGWLKDKFGLSWQIIPNALGELMGDKDPQKAQRVMQAMMKMDKIDIEKLKEAYNG
jgi:predicted 3-demethylubiquinone-9 3-methyltransferase (glyoxalase superfamily)